MVKQWLPGGGALLVCLLPLSAQGQEQPLSVIGTFTTGYYSTTTKGDANQSLDFVPLGARFDVSGYYLSPDLVSFSAQPEVNIGPQASEAGFQGGNGIRLNVTLLRKSIIPLTFHYANVQVEDVYFGSLTQVSGYSLKNRNKDLGLTWEFKPKHLPSTIVDWGTGSVNSQSGIAEISDYQSHGNHVNVDTHYELQGWDLDGFAHRQVQQSDLLAPLGQGTTRGSLLQTVEQYQGSGRRSFLGDSELFVDGGAQSTSSLLFTLPVDLNTHYINANLRLRQKRRWKSSLRAGYSSNLASQLLAQAAGSLGGPGALVPDSSVLAPFSHGISSFNVSGLTSVALAHGFSLFGSAERNEILAASEEGPLNSNYFTASAGVNYAKGFGWGGVSAEYAREYGVGSVTGQTGRIQGDRYSAGVHRGSSGGLQTDLSVHGNDQSVHTLQPLSNKSVSIEGSVADRVYRDFSARAGGGWQWSTFINAANEFRTNGYTARAGIEHPRVQVGASLNSSLSNSLPFFSQFFSGVGLGSVLVPSLQIVPSDYRAVTCTVHSNPLRKVELSGAWTRSIQHLDGILNNDFELLQVSATYHFRRVQMELGFIRYNQVFAASYQTMRERFFIRFQRSAKIL